MNARYRMASLARAATMVTRKVREHQLLAKAVTDTGREELIRIYRRTLDGNGPMPVAVYHEIIEAILNAEFPSEKAGSR